MKIWRIAFAMLAAFSLTSCSSDDDNEDEKLRLPILRRIQEMTGTNSSSQFCFLVVAILRFSMTLS